MQREPKVGMSVVYKQADDSGPLSSYQSRYHPALVAGVSEGGLDLIVMPFGNYSTVYARFVPKGKPDFSGPCWYWPEEG